METKFYTFDQNNSGGSFINSDSKGISEYVIIEAKNAKEANNKAENIGIYFDGCSNGNDCSCCGDRWYETCEGDGYENPSIYGELVENIEKSSFRKSCFIHYLDNTFKKIEFKDKK